MTIKIPRNMSSAPHQTLPRAKGHAQSRAIASVMETKLAAKPIIMTSGPNPTQTSPPQQQQHKHNVTRSEMRTAVSRPVDWVAG
mmetsp:Transcript_97049/g.289915  ORF Transcript_97049/g.289915 Transcript_97049/m.289915 type:complete len:84 (-) Transcript_97049:157-408(-)